jgi:hypothetical protein
MVAASLKTYGFFCVNDIVSGALKPSKNRIVKVSIPGEIILKGGAR